MFPWLFIMGKISHHTNKCDRRQRLPVSNKPWLRFEMLTVTTLSFSLEIAVRKLNVCNCRAEPA